MRITVVFAVAMTCASAFAADAGRPAPASTPPARLDGGHLDPAWFGSGNPIEFRATDVVDYLWVKPGFSLDGRRLHMSPWEPAIPEADDEEIDRKTLLKMTEIMPDLCMAKWEKAFKGNPACSLTDGDVAVIGRFVEINVPQAFSLAWPHQTFDIKFVDKATGELLVAMHHSTGYRAKAGMKLWCGDVAKAMRKGLGPLYAEGKTAEK